MTALAGSFQVGLMDDRRAGRAHTVSRGREIVHQPREHLVLVVQVAVVVEQDRRAVVHLIAGTIRQPGLGRGGLVVRGCLAVPADDRAVGDRIGACLVVAPPESGFGQGQVLFDVAVYGLHGHADAGRDDGDPGG